MQSLPVDLEITRDDLSQLGRPEPVFVTLGETLVRDTPADMERPERTRLVYLAMAGSEFSVAVGLSRLGISSAYVTRVPDNPYGRALRNIAREQGVNTDYFVWAPKTEPIGRLLYEIGRTPRPNVAIYQRMYSAASRLGAGMVDWQSALAQAALIHVSGITFGLAVHSQYERNYCLEAFLEAMSHKPMGCLVGCDLNYRSTLWSLEQARTVLTPVLTDHVDILVTTIQDMAQFYGFGCGRYSAEQILAGQVGRLEDESIYALARQVMDRFGLRIVAFTMRQPVSFEEHRWEAAAADSRGHYFRSPSVGSVTLQDRLGGGDMWTAGFYYGLLTAGFEGNGIARGILVGDAATRLQQTLMFDLPMVDKEEIEALMKAELSGKTLRTSR
jgi:2-dehydro-3-deoxygluconokinase